MEEQDHARATNLAQLRQDIRDGLDSGEPTPWNPQEIQAGRQRKKGSENRRQRDLGMPSITQLPRAVTDLAEIRDYIADDGEGSADAFFDLLDRKIHAFARRPDMGQLVEGLRSFPVSRYIIFYRVMPKGIEIVRVLHGACDLDAIFNEETIEVGDLLRIDPQKYEVAVEGMLIDLTATEFRILQLLASKMGWVFSRYTILTHLWGSENTVSDRTVDVHIRHLREKMGKAGILVKNMRGIGYKFEA
jgi:plasmid stabilization system protein ParE/DNA-binding CsgD family transcriptional regulator